MFGISKISLILETLGFLIQGKYERFPGISGIQLSGISEMLRIPYKLINIQYTNLF